MVSDVQGSVQQSLSGSGVSQVQGGCNSQWKGCLTYRVGTTVSGSSVSRRGWPGTKVSGSGVSRTGWVQLLVEVVSHKQGGVQLSVEVVSHVHGGVQQSLFGSGV